MGKTKRRKRTVPRDGAAVAKPSKPAAVAKPAASKPAAAPASKPAAAPKSKRGGSLQDKLRQKLAGGRFRQLNEDLYTSSGADNFSRFQRDPELAAAYHRGFREQAAGWPANPLDGVIAALARLPGRKVVADFGCGDARLAAELAARHDVRSFDLVATAPGVVACDMARTPLATASVDAAVFCLALMGPSLWAFLAEAARVLKPGGLLKIVEVKSRFEGAGGVGAFVAGVRTMGFEAVAEDAANSMFVALDFRRTGSAPAKKRPSFAFRACVYKKR